MTTPNRLGNAVTWTIIFLAALWLALIVVPQFTDRISRHEDSWAREFEEMASGKVSKAD
jgi:hypothetical protein